MWALGMAIGIILIDLKPDDLSTSRNHLSASILAVSRASLGLMAVLDCIILLIVIGLYKEFLKTTLTTRSLH